MPLARTKRGFTRLAGGGCDGPLVQSLELSYTMNVNDFEMALRLEMQRVNAAVSCGEPNSALSACGESATHEFHSACGEWRESSPLPQNASGRPSNH